MATSSTRNAAINLRARPNQRDLIDRACKILDKNRSDFMLETACREAENILLNQTLFKLDGSAFKAFDKLLKAPVKNNPALNKLMKSTAPWQE
ncbi:MAG: DUF1778 domain-containing protein [Gammaproteobacteria bacterium]|nr:MAG: DUF1778 domain-containing protein [Gammaproteobacteria bacterium]